MAGDMGGLSPWSKSTSLTAATSFSRALISSLIRLSSHWMSTAISNSELRRLERRDSMCTTFTFLDYFQLDEWSSFNFELTGFGRKLSTHLEHFECPGQSTRLIFQREDHRVYWCIRTRMNSIFLLLLTKIKFKFHWLLRKPLLVNHLQWIFWIIEWIVCLLDVRPRNLWASTPLRPCGRAIGRANLCRIRSSCRLTKMDATGAGRQMAHGRCRWAFIGRAPPRRLTEERMGADAAHPIGPISIDVRGRSTSKRSSAHVIACLNDNETNPLAYHQPSQLQTMLEHWSYSVEHGGSVADFQLKCNSSSAPQNGGHSPATASRKNQALPEIRDDFRMAKRFSWRLAILSSALHAARGALLLLEHSFIRQPERPRPFS